MNKKLSGLVAVVALVLVALPLIASCAPAKEAPPAAPAAEVKPDAVWFRATCAMTGPYAASLLPMVEATKEAMDYINTERDGIDGVPWKFEILDDGADVAKAIANYEQLKVKEPKCILTSVWHSGTAEALRERFNEDGIICSTCAPSAAGVYPAGNTFPIIVSYADGFGLFCDWLAETQPKPIKLGFCTWDSTMGRAILTDECLNYAKQKGIEIVATELYGVMEMDVSTQLTNLKKAGANWVYTNTLGFGTVVLLKSADALGLVGGEMHFAGCHFAMDNDVNYLAGPRGEGFVGYHTMITWYETDNPVVQERRAAFEAAGRGEEVRSQPWLVFRGWFQLMETIYERAIAEVGWENLDSNALKDQLVQLKDYDAGVTTFTYSADKPEPRHARIVQFKGGKILPITDWRVCPDLRPAEYK